MCHIVQSNHHLLMLLMAIGGPCVSGELSSGLRCSPGSQVTVVNLLTSLTVERAPKASCVCVSGMGGWGVVTQFQTAQSILEPLWAMRCFCVRKRGGRAKANSVDCCAVSFETLNLHLRGMFTLTSAHFPAICLTKPSPRLSSYLPNDD